MKSVSLSPGRATCADLKASWHGVFDIISLRCNYVILSQFGIDVNPLCRFRLGSGRLELWIAQDPLDRAAALTVVGGHVGRKYLYLSKPLYRKAYRGLYTKRVFSVQRVQINRRYRSGR